MASSARLRRALPLLLTAAYAWFVARDAWLSDDAYISYRTIDHLLDGYGLRWNVADRVQVFTHPLWLLLLSGVQAVVGNIWVTGLAVSWALSVFVMLRLARWAGRGAGAALVAVVALCLSRSFVDYSTSGLENPLTHALLLAFAAFATRRDLEPTARISGLALVTGLMACNRLDSLLLVLPVLVAATWSAGRAAVRPLVLGFVPLVAWLVFATVYFGFPLPNTAYAKLAAGIPSLELAQQGLRYFVSCFLFDPLGVTLLLFVLGWTAWKRERLAMLWMSGAVLQLLYLLRVGGDFMAGRFLAAPILMAAIAWVWRPPPLHGRMAPGLAAALLVTALLWPSSPLRSGKHEYDGQDWEEQIDSRGVSDERGVYYRATNPLLWSPGQAMPDHEWADWSREQRRRGFRGAVTLRSAGYFGYFLGPDVHAMDRFALVDAYLARRPWMGGSWRPGHYERTISPEYRESLRTGQNHLIDAESRRLYEDIRLITRGPLFSRARWAAIVRQNLRGFGS